MDRVRIGSIGAGAIAQRHLAALARVDDAVVVGITSRTREKADALASLYAIPLVAATLDELQARAAPDALMLCVSMDQMAAVAMHAMAFGVPLFLEKPAGMTPQETAMLAQEAQRRSIQTMVGFNRRYISVLQQGKAIIAQHGPLLGVAVEGHERMWRQADGLLTDVMRRNWIFANSIHTIDLLRFFGGEVEIVHVIAQRRFGEPRGDQFAAVMEFVDGAIGEYHAYWYSPGGWSVTLYGDGVTVRCKPLEQGCWVDRQLIKHPIDPDPVDMQEKPGFVKQGAAFCAFVRTGILPAGAQDIAGALQSMRLAEQLVLPPL